MAEKETFLEICKSLNNAADAGYVTLSMLIPLRDHCEKLHPDDETERYRAPIRMRQNLVRHDQIFDHNECLGKL
jgi:hypothetical protein